MPMIMANAVINTGRMRTKPASMAACLAFRPSASCSRAKETTKMLFDGHACAEAHKRTGHRFHLAAPLHLRSSRQLGSEVRQYFLYVCINPG